MKTSNDILQEIEILYDSLDADLTNEDREDIQDKIISELYPLFRQLRVEKKING